MKSAGVVVLAVLALGGCDRMKAAMNKDDAGAAASGGSGGGILSFLHSDFEGEITMQPTERGKVGKPIVIEMKKPKYRFDVDDGPQKSGSFILDVPAKKATLLMHPAKTAMVMDLDQLKNMKGQLAGMTGHSAPGTAPTDAPPKIEKTGKTDTVAGYTCDEWKITQTDGRRADACVAEGITWVDMGGIGGVSTLGAFASDANHFPLRVIGYDKSGAPESRFEATKIEKKSIDAGRFVIPADYKLMDMAALMQGKGIPPGMVPAAK